MSVHQFLASATQKSPHAVAMQYQGKSVTWNELQRRVARRASEMQDQGLQAGDRVALLCANVPECMEAQFAVPWAALVLVPLNTRLSLAEHIYILQHCDCKQLYFDERNSALVEQIQSAIPALNCSLLAPLDHWDMAADTLQTRKEAQFLPSEGASTAAIFYTGGTTGRPKGVELSHLALMLQGLSAKDSYDFDAATVFLHSAPMFHLADYCAALGATAAMARHSFLPEFTPDAVLDRIEDEGVNAVIMVPTMIRAVLNAAKARPNVIQRLKQILYGSAPIQAPLLLQLLNEAPGVGLIQVYGQSEIGGACTALGPRYHVLEGSDSGKIGSAGRMVPAFMARIIGAMGEVLPNGETGEIQISGPGMMKSYWNDPELTKRTIHNGWLHTGDLGFLDDDGFLTIAGRLKDMIISGGENVFAGEVESALMEHTAVETAAVIGVPDAKWGEAVHAVVCLKYGQSADEAELIAFCRERIAHYKSPRGITIRETPLPLSGVGKVRKVELLKEWTDSNQ